MKPYGSQYSDWLGLKYPNPYGCGCCKVSKKMKKVRTQKRRARRAGRLEIRQQI